MQEPSSDLDRLAHEVIGAAIEVHRRLGPGFLEAVYENALVIELKLRGIRYQTQVNVKLDYKGFEVGTHRLDLLVEEQLVVELKAVDKVLPIHEAQVMSYLKATNAQLGLLINFNAPLLRDGGIRRMILNA